MTYMKEKGYSSTLQPLDAAPFANLKNKIWRLYDQKKSFTTEQLRTLSQELVPVVLQAHDCLTPELLRSAFQKTGVFPFDLKIILKNARANIGAQIVDPSPTDKAVNLLLKVFDTMKTASGVE
ncbi:hypothetical protein HDU79_004577 [Rhizoclosmatium sp. JEL0117]|nr:hypothetical protein HDU79_004577 [Rhizoclosmatium sp. JEL0117]